MLVSGLIAARLSGRSSAVEPTNARNRTYCPAGTADRSTSIDVPRGIRPSTGTDTVRRATAPEPVATFHPPGMTKWLKSDERRTRAAERRQVLGGDTELVAYNAYLQTLNRADRARR